MKPHRGMRPQDIIILLKIIAKGTEPWFNKHLAAELHMSASEVTESLNRSQQVGLLSPSKNIVMVAALLDFLMFGLRYVYPTQPGALVKGMPTSHSAPVLAKYFPANEKFVWPDADGTERGQAIEPLYPTVPQAAREDRLLYDLLALTDVFRVGKTREIKMAKDLLDKIIHGYQKYQHIEK
jgi:hypothetical protein